MTRHALLIAACAGFHAAAAVCAADPTIELRTAATPGDVEVRLSGLPASGVAGYQIFLEYDPARMAFISGTYDTASFGLTFLAPIAAANSRLSLAAGINAAFGQLPTAADQTVATLHFTFVGSGCEPRIRIRDDATPPTRLTDESGEPIAAVAFVNAWNICGADFNQNGHLDVPDIFDFLAAWFAQSCRADFNNAGGLGVQDIFDFLSAWFSGC